MRTEHEINLEQCVGWAHDYIANDERIQNMGHKWACSRLSTGALDAALEADDEESPVYKAYWMYRSLWTMNIASGILQNEFLIK